MDKEKAKYRPRNWRQYNKSLVLRGSLTLWVDDKVINQWYEISKNKKPGCARLYSDLAIQCAAQIRALYRLPLRSVQGFLESLFDMLELRLDVPHYSTISRRMKKLRIKLKYTKQNNYNHIVLDSSGLKIYGEGEWKVKQHGWSKRRTWKKMHIGIDTDTQEIVCCSLTNSKIQDPTMFNYCLDQIEQNIEQVSVDGIYDTENCYKYAHKRKIKFTVPPRITAINKFNKYDPNTKHFKTRDDAMQHINCLGFKCWKEWSGYSKRSLVETAMYRFKKMFSGRLSSREGERRDQEFMIKCNIFNLFTRLGMPKSKKIIPKNKVS